MSEAAESAIEQLEDQLEGAEHTLSALSSLSDQQAQRVAQRMDRLASQLLEVSARQRSTTSITDSARSPSS